MFICSFRVSKAASLSKMMFAEWAKKGLQVSSQNFVYVTQHDCDEV